MDLPLPAVRRLQEQAKLRLIWNNKLTCLWAGYFYGVCYPGNCLRVTPNRLSETESPEFSLNGNKLTRQLKPAFWDGPQVLQNFLIAYNSIVLQKVRVVCCCCYRNFQKKAINIGRERDHHSTLIVDLPYREITKKVKLSVSTVLFTIEGLWEIGGNSDRKRSGRPKATTESVDKYLKSSRMMGSSEQQLQEQPNDGRSQKVSFSSAKRRLPVAGLQQEN